MPRYVVERTFPDRLVIPANCAGAEAIRTAIDADAEHGVTWVTSYVNTDRTKTYCICDAPDPEALRTAAASNRLPVDLITEVRVLDPYFYF